jgi:hypothetical protein
VHHSTVCVFFLSPLGANKKEYIDCRIVHLVIFKKYIPFYRGAVKYLEQPGRRKATVTEDFDFHISYL